MTLPTDPLPATPPEIRAKPATPFKDDFRNLASFNRLDYYVKNPIVLVGSDTNFNFQNFIRDEYGFKISGSYMQFNSDNSDEGVFIINAAGTETKVDNYSWQKPSNIVFTPTLTIPVQGQVEQTIEVRTRYSENGDIRTGILAKKARALNEVDITGGTGNVFVIGTGNANVTLTAAGFAYPTLTLKLQRKPDGIVYFSACDTPTGFYSDETPIYSNDSGLHSYDVYEPNVGNTITILVASPSTLHTMIQEQGGEIYEVCDVTL